MRRLPVFIVASTSIGLALHVISAVDTLEHIAQHPKQWHVRASVEASVFTVDV